MQFRVSVFSVALLTCVFTLASASPLPQPLNIPSIVVSSHISDMPIAREAQPEPSPVCARFQCE
ncbi:hypothetical protein BDN70DRAFT_878293 [Pholiota conissans]|uniref:Uncharacterized protein n=1 Tax=Pholiota conissans TaxID=109636 RepID=A0A9P5Z5L8_9AGAR|nr:hypothetical protein BDN70DRAFT_878293 [Pholiota conissans]